MPRYHGYQALVKNVKKIAIFKGVFCPEFFQSHDCALAFCQVRIWTSSMPKISDVTQKLREKWLFKVHLSKKYFASKSLSFLFLHSFPRILAITDWKYIMCPANVCMVLPAPACAGTRFFRNENYTSFFLFLKML